MTKILVLAGILLLLSGTVAGTSYVQANGENIAKINESGVYYIHSDNLGSTSAITNEAGKVVEEQINLPFGETLEGSERYGFTGKELDSDLNLQYFGARYYNPATGTFLTTDPALHGFSPYPYADNNPMRYVDPDGRKPRNYDKLKDWQKALYSDVMSVIKNNFKSKEFVELENNLIYDLYVEPNVKTERKMSTFREGEDIPKTLASRLGISTKIEVPMVIMFKDTFSKLNDKEFVQKELKGILPLEIAASFAHELYHLMTMASQPENEAEIGSHGTEATLTRQFFGSLDNLICRDNADSFLRYILLAVKQGRDPNYLFDDPNNLIESYEKDRILELSRSRIRSVRDPSNNKYKAVFDSDETYMEVLGILDTVGHRARDAVKKFNEEKAKEKKKK